MCLWSHTLKTDYSQSCSAKNISIIGDSAKPTTTTTSFLKPPNSFTNSAHSFPCVRTWTCECVRAFVFGSYSSAFGFVYIVRPARIVVGFIVVVVVVVVDVGSKCCCCCWIICCCCARLPDVSVCGLVFDCVLSAVVHPVTVLCLKSTPRTTTPRFRMKVISHSCNFCIPHTIQQDYNISRRK